MYVGVCVEPVQMACVFFYDRVLIKRAALYVYILIANIKFFVLCLCLAPLFSCKIFDHKGVKSVVCLRFLWYKALASMSGTLSDVDMVTAVYYVHPVPTLLRLYTG